MAILALRMIPEGERRPLRQASEKERGQALKSQGVSRGEEEEERARQKQQSPSRAKTLQRQTEQAQVTHMLWGTAKTTLWSWATPGQEERARGTPQSWSRGKASLRSWATPARGERAWVAPREWGRAWIGRPPKTTHRSRFPCHRASAVQPPCQGNVPAASGYPKRLGCRAAAVLWQGDFGNGCTL